MYAEKKSNTQGIVEEKARPDGLASILKPRAVSMHELELGRKENLPGRNVRNWSR
jgi:hypothetical protein